MNGAHDMGGVHGFGPVVPEADEPPFHGAWEKRALALTLAMGATGSWNIDMSRFAREDRPPGEYLSLSYYQIWLAGLERLMAERGLVTEADLAAGRAVDPPKRLARVMAAADVPSVLARGGPTGRPVAAAPLYSVGDRVRMRNIHPPTHTRLPRYARGKTGTVELLHGGHVFPDDNAAGRGENPQHLYTVRFAGTELWGPESDPSVSVSVDAWESYLEPAEAA